MQIFADTLTFLYGLMLACTVITLEILFLSSMQNYELLDHEILSVVTQHYQIQVNLKNIYCIILGLINSVQPQESLLSGEEYLCGLMDSLPCFMHLSLGRSHKTKLSYSNCRP